MLPQLLWSVSEPPGGKIGFHNHNGNFLKSIALRQNCSNVAQLIARKNSSERRYSNVTVSRTRRLGYKN